MNRDSGELFDRKFNDLLDLIEPDDLLVFNDTRVIPARLFGTKETGGKIEILIERILNEHEALAHIRSSKSPKGGSKSNWTTVIFVKCYAEKTIYFI